jgi:hypothetical protein
VAKTNLQKHSPEPESQIGTRMPTEKLVAILKLHDAGESGRQIALKVGSDGRTIAAVIKRFRDRVSTAKAMLAQSSIEMAKHWLDAVPIAAQRGDHRPAKELLQAVGAVAVGGVGQGQGGDVKVAIQVVVGTPEHPITYDPVKN